MATAIPRRAPSRRVVVVGDSQQVSITKQVAVVGGGAAVPGAQLEYVVRVLNIASVPALNVVITDDLDAPQPGQLAYVNGSATMNGSAAGVTVAGSTITANYAAVIGPLEPGGIVVLRFRAILAPGLAEGTVVTNTGVVTWNQPTQTASASVPVIVGGIPGFAVLNGSAWHDADFDNVRDSGERALAGWAVDLYRDGQLVHSALVDAAGVYRIIGVDPNNVSNNAYELRFRAPGAGANTAMLGTGRLAVHERTAADHRHRRAAERQSAGAEPADPSERRHLQLDRAHHRLPGRPSPCWMPAAPRPCRRAASTMRPSKGRSRSRTAITSSTSTSATRPARAAVITSSG